MPQEVTVSLVFKRGPPPQHDCFVYEICWPNGSVWRYELNPYNAIVVSKAYRHHKSKLKFANAIKQKADKATLTKKKPTTSSPEGEVGADLEREENPIDEPAITFMAHELLQVINDSSNPIIIQWDDFIAKPSISKVSQTVNYLRRKKPKDRQAIMESVTQELERIYNLNMLTSKEEENAKYDIVILYANEIIEKRVSSPPFLDA